MKLNYHTAEAGGVSSTDVVMSEMSGPQLAERLKRVRPNLKVLFMSGYTNNAIVHQRLDQEQNFIQKPFPPVSLAKKFFAVPSKA